MSAALTIIKNSLWMLFQDLIHKGACPSEVERWSHHCTCEWLKAIDLAEFTPNLLCAGIHGALIVGFMQIHW